VKHVCDSQHGVEQLPYLAAPQCEAEADWTWASKLAEANSNSAPKRILMISASSNQVVGSYW